MERVDDHHSMHNSSNNMPRSKSVLEIKELLKNSVATVFDVSKISDSTKMEYMAYINQSQSHWKQLAVNIIITIYTLITIIGVFADALNKQSKYSSSVGAYISYALILFAFFAVNTLGWLLYGVLVPNLRLTIMKRSWATMQSNRNTIQAMFQFALTGFNIIAFLGRLFQGPCSRFIFSFCNPYQDVESLPINSLMIMICLSLAPVTILRETRINVILVNWLMVVVSYMFSCFYVSSKVLFLGCLAYILISGLIILDVFHLNFETFITARQLKSALEENERIAATDRATEMRHMIANVAHDLKTVRDEISLSPHHLLYLSISNIFIPQTAAAVVLYGWNGCNQANSS